MCEIAKPLLEAGGRVVAPDAGSELVKTQRKCTGIPHVTCDSAWYAQQFGFSSLLLLVFLLLVVESIVHKQGSSSGGIQGLLRVESGVFFWWNPGSSSGGINCS